MKTLLKAGWILALLIAAAVYPVVGLINSRAVDVYMIAGKTPEMVKRNRALLGLDDPSAPDYKWKVMQAYGSREEETTQVVFVPAEKLVRPPEYPDMVLLPVDPSWNPVQSRTLWFFAQWIACGAGVVGVLLLLGWVTLRKRAAPPA